MKISAVINTFNEEKNITRAIKSVAFTDEVIVCDMHSTDQTAEIAKKLGAKVVFHKHVGFVEPARNFAISEAKNDWIFILDADEEISSELASRLQQIAELNSTDYVQIPRKNIIFGHWMKYAMWWPDYHVRFFKKGHVSWKNEIHSKPEVDGRGATLDGNESLAIVHHHYTSVSEFINRMNRYTDIQAKDLVKDNYRFMWPDLILKPLDEFLSRYFALQGFRDGLHGLTLSLLQAFSHFVVYLKVWEIEKFEERDLQLEDIKVEFRESGRRLKYWINNVSLSDNPLIKVIQKIRNKFS